MSDDEKTFELLKLAGQAAGRVVGQVGEDDLDRPTPSADWSGRELANHFVLWTAYALEKRGLREDMGEDLTSRDFVAEPGWQAAYDEQLERALAVWSDPAVFEGEIGSGDGAMAARDTAVMLLMEFVLHGWDLAKATGGEYVADPALGEGVLPHVEKWAQMYRDYEGFAAPVEVPADASALDRALALSGRDPNWTP
ncbi:TIGR03086 family metal-binding protein [Phytomonospora sp. NPDC050363]|uniref:TIGR03086 family metal-binding protein n=1 Tax=Phytomonospora sp. NPDC050363 TaxID=3155642 RepID=UPI00340C7EA7